MKKPILPKKPVDGYTLVWYEMYRDTATAKVYKHTAVYHKNTKWSDYDPSRSGGVDLVDDWMYYTDDSKYGDGRSCGWESVHACRTNYLSHFRIALSWKDDYETYEEAAKAAIAWCNDRIEWFKKEIGWSEECIREFATQLMMMGKESK